MQHQISTLGVCLPRYMCRKPCLENVLDRIHTIPVIVYHYLEKKIDFNII